MSETGDMFRPDSVLSEPSPDVQHAAIATRLSRRRFLALVGATVASSLLTACMDDDEENGDGAGTPTLVDADETPGSAIETPQTDGTPATDGSPTTDDEADADVARFLVLSRALTGFDDLGDTEIAHVYLDSIMARDDLDGQLDALYEKAELGEDTEAVTLEQLERAGAFAPDTRPVADAITTYWYTGRFSPPAAAAGETHVATYIDALAWQATGYRATGPSTCSGQVGNWAEAIAA